MRINLDKFMGRRPVLIGVVTGVRFYEHPTRGDEAGMIAVYNGEAVSTDWYDLPDPGDFDTADDFMRLYR